MKRIYKFLIVTVVAMGSMFYSCETLELENLASPNALAPDQADPDLLFNSIQLNYRNAMATFSAVGGDLSRADYMFGRNYFDNFGPGTLNGPWGNLYSAILPDLNNIIAIDEAAEDVDLSFQVGASQVMAAHIVMLMVDFLGDTIWSQAFNPSEFPSPSVDDDADVYAQALDVLAEGTARLQSATSTGNALDMYYGGDLDKWVRYANTIKMRADLTVGNYTAVINATNVIGEGDDMTFEYGTNQNAPDTRHPDYNTDYRSDGAGIYQHNWLMDLMTGDFGELSANNDPRRRYYWYRQTWRTPGSFALFEDVLGLFGAPGLIYISNGDGVGETLQCSLQDTPTHLQLTPDEEYWCSMRLGYWGRHHGNDEGTPPDNFLRTAVGVYPAGGSFDAVADAFPYVGVFPNIGQQVGLGNGAGGAGIEPIIMASAPDFWRAEAYLATGNPTMAAQFLQAGMTKSINTVVSFGPRDSSADLSNAPTAGDINAFIGLIVGAFNAAPAEPTLDGFGWPVAKSKWDILGEQYLVAIYGGAMDGWNFVRRTGYPTTLARNIEEIPGPYPRTLLYPSNETIANPNITQRTDNSTLVFWDSGVLNPAN